jgi:nitroreductase
VPSYSELPANAVELRSRLPPLIREQVHEACSSCEVSYEWEARNVRRHGVPTKIEDLGTVIDLLTTTRAVRKRLDFRRPVEIEVILDALRIAVQAPNAGNRQRWRWIVITDETLKRRLADEYRRGLAAAKEQSVRPAVGSLALERLRSSSDYLAENLEEAPVMVLPCTEQEVGPVGWGPSIYPAVWSFQLALRSRGLGSCLTTAHLYRREQVAQLLGIPDSIVQTCLLPVAHINGELLLPAPRKAVDEIVTFNGWTNGVGG